MIYADWIASGRLYRPIEERIINQIGPFVANTHTETSESGTRMTNAYHHAQHLIKKHVNAGPDDVLITAGFGMTAVINKFHRILGFKSCGKLMHKECLYESTERPIVFITHMEHHSNHTSWYSTNCDVVIIPPCENMLVSEDNLRKELEKYKDRKLKIGSFSAASNVTGIITPYHKLAKIMHEYGGLCFIDFAASAPYVDMNMHPEDPMEKLDAIMFSPHKFLGGPGTSGVLIFDKSLYKNEVPDHPGGGTVDWTNAWGEYKFIDDIELREDGGTPGFLQTIKTALCIELKNEMGTKAIMEREHELIDKAIDGLCAIEGVRVLCSEQRDRIGAISFYHENIHFNLMVKLLSDKFGVQVRGGCACAGTYGHILLDVDYETSRRITEQINLGDLSQKPGWIRLSVHPTMTDKELDTFVDAVATIAKNIEEWQKDYEYSSKTNEFYYHGKPTDKSVIAEWFNEF
jgi:selenocysteine lyase/cysteine desulfurase